ncbi:baseplate assembly protein [Roseibium algae]|uniref:Baseplate assembly protein n=1 Tax=Roseibium algae TaxID=3123038 RepID=A0ABU8TJW9_9HYPH
MYDILLRQRADLEMLKTAFGNSLKVGPIEVVDPARGYRVKLADGPDGPVLSPFYPHPESGGQSLSWMPLSKGQIVGVVNPSGDGRQGVLLRGGFSGDASAPSQDLLANVLKTLGITITIKDGKLRLQGDLEVEGNVRLVGNVDFESGHVEHNGKNIGDDHVHKGVVPGGSTTKGPL